MSAQEKSPNDPNRGMNLKVWFTSIIVAVIVLIVLAYIFLLGTAKKDIPKANQPHSNSRLVMPIRDVSTSIT